MHVESWRETYSALLPEEFFGSEALGMRLAMWTTVLALDPVPGTVVVADRERAIRGFAFAWSEFSPLHLASHRAGLTYMSTPPLF